MAFEVTVRDNRAAGGGIATAQTQVMVDADGRPICRDITQQRRYVGRRLDADRSPGASTAPMRWRQMSGFLCRSTAV